MNNNKRLEWMLHEYFEALERKRRPVPIANPTNGMIKDGGHHGASFVLRYPKALNLQT